MMRYENLELLRIFASIGVVFFHLSNVLGFSFYKYGYTGLIVFLLISTTLLFIKDKSEEDFLIYAQKKANRLLLPFLGWSIFYLAILIYMDGIRQTINNSSISTLFAGTYYHLWYLPFIFLISILSYWLNEHPAGKKIKSLTLESLLLLSIISFFLQSMVTSVFDFPSPWQQWITSIPTIFLGLSIAQSIKVRNKYRNPIASKIPIQFALGTLVLLMAHRLGFHKLADNNMYALSYLFGVLAFYFSFFVKPSTSRSINSINSVSSLTLGVYLIHPFVILFAIKFFSETPFWGLLLLVLTVSFLTTYFLKQIPIVRRFV